MECCLDLCLSLNEARDEATGMDFKKTGKIQLDTGMALESNKVKDLVQNVNTFEEEDDDDDNGEKREGRKWSASFLKFRKKKKMSDDDVVENTNAIENDTPV